VANKAIDKAKFWKDSEDATEAVKETKKEKEQNSTSEKKSLLKKGLDKATFWKKDK